MVMPGPVWDTGQLPETGKKEKQQYKINDKLKKRWEEKIILNAGKNYGKLIHRRE